MTEYCRWCSEVVEEGENDGGWIHTEVFKTNFGPSICVRPIGPIRRVEAEESGFLMGGMTRAAPGGRRPKEEDRVKPPKGESRSFKVKGVGPVGFDTRGRGKREKSTDEPAVEAPNPEETAPPPDVDDESEVEEWF